MSGGEMDSQLKDQFAEITSTILSNQTEALGNLTKKVEKEIGQVWRQMGIMYGQVSSSIKILEKVLFTFLRYFCKSGSQKRNFDCMKFSSFKKSPVFQKGLIFSPYSTAQNCKMSFLFGHGYQ